MSVSVFVLLALLWSAALGVASAQEPPPEDPNLPLSGLDDSVDKIVMQKASRCANLENPDQKIDVIVQFARTPLQDSKEIRACYDTLTEHQKAQVFYQVAEKLGLGEELGTERHNTPSQNVQPLAYGTLLMPYAAIAFGERRTAEVYWIDNGNRCPTGRGTEYNFQYRFSSNVTNPASLRSNSPTNLLVDAALVHYT